MKRIRQTKINIGNNNTKIRKLSETTMDINRSSTKLITHFEDLSNELFYEIFEFLNFHQAFESFFDLNIRFQNLFLLSNFPLKINISSISKSTFQYFHTEILIHKSHQIKSFRLSNTFSTNIILTLFPIISKFTHLQTLCLHNIQSKYLENILNNLAFLTNLSSLTIESFDEVENQNNLYRQIFRLSKLKYCQVLFKKNWIPIPLPIATDEFSSIEHFIINNNVLFNQLDSLLSYIPNIRRLSFRSLSGFYDKRIRLIPIKLNYLINVSLQLDSMDFDQFELLFKNFFHQIQILSVSINLKDFNFDQRYLNANQWKRLILFYTPYLRIFDFQHQCYILNNIDDWLVYEDQINKFNSLFWIEHQWNFAYQYYQRGNFNAVIFYSIDPYRKKNYFLYGKTNKTIRLDHNEININSVRHIHIYNEHAINNCVNYFPNVDKLTFLYDINIVHNSIITNLNNIISLKKLTQLVINCQSFSFEQMLELLNFASNIHTLKFDCIFLYEKDFISLKQNEIFHLVSKTNIVTKLIVEEEELTLEKIQLFIELFTRLEYLTNNLNEENMESIIRYILLKTNKNTRHLSLWCISKQNQYLIEKFRNLIQSEKLLHDYTIKIINQKLYLWY